MTDIIVTARSAAPPAGVAISGIIVRLYTEDGDFLQADTTNDDGEAFLGSRDEGVYEVRMTFAANGVVESGNARFTVDVDGVTDVQIFDQLVTVSALPEPTLSGFCRCHGAFAYLDGRPARDTSIVFKPTINSPRIRPSSPASSIGLIHTEVLTRTNSAGVADVSLLRNVEYFVTLPGSAYSGWNIVVPDTSRAVLPDVVFPVPAVVEYWEDGDRVDSLIVTQGTSIRVDLITVFRSGLRLTGLRSVALAVSVSGYCTFTLDGSVLVIYGRYPGTVTLTAEPHNYGPGYGFPCFGADTLNSIEISVVDDPDIPNVDPPSGDENSENPNLILDGGWV